jgi:2'-5' RNA ligase
MRAFITCPLPAEVTAYLQQVCKSLPAGKLIVPQQFDLTLKFLGEISEELIPQLQDRLQHLRITPFEVHLNSIGVFAPHHIRVVWVGVEPVEPLLTVHEQLEQALTSLASSDERFFPHITLARVRSLQDRKNFLDELRLIRIEPLLVPINHLVLMKSELTASGAIHTPLFETLCN